MSAPIEFWFEFASTYSYPAAHRIERACARAGVGLAWRPFLLGPIFREQGWNDSPFNLYPAKGRYMWRDLERTCESLELPFARPSEFPRNGLLAARVAHCFRDTAWLPEFVRRVYRANFAEDRDIAAADVVASVLRAQGLDPGPILDASSSDENKAGLRRATTQAAELGIFGAPTFVVGSEIFWGNDRLEAAVARSTPRRP